MKMQPRIDWNHLLITMGANKFAAKHLVTILSTGGQYISPSLLAHVRTHSDQIDCSDIIQYLERPHQIELLHKLVHQRIDMDMVRIMKGMEKPEGFDELLESLLPDPFGPVDEWKPAYLAVSQIVDNADNILVNLFKAGDNLKAITSLLPRIGDIYPIVGFQLATIPESVRVDLIVKILETALISDETYQLEKLVHILLGQWLEPSLAALAVPVEMHHFYLDRSSTLPPVDLEPRTVSVLWKHFISRLDHDTWRRLHKRLSKLNWII